MVTAVILALATKIWVLQNYEPLPTLGLLDKGKSTNHCMGRQELSSVVRNCNVIQLAHFFCKGTIEVFCLYTVQSMPEM